MTQLSAEYQALADYRPTHKVRFVMTGLAVGQLEGAVDATNEESGLIYQDDDGGFTCGSTGKPPIPFPWPPKSMPGIEDLLARRALDEDTLDFLDTAVRAGANPAQLLRNPAAVAKEAGVCLAQAGDHG